MALISEGHVSRSFIPWGFTVEYSIGGECDAPQLSRLADACLHLLLPPELWREQYALDLKGREPQDLLIENVPSELRPAGLEIAFVAGRVFLDEHDVDMGGGRVEKRPPAAKSGETGEPFQLRLTSDFDEFVGAAHIRYRLHQERLGALPGFIPFRDAGRIVPAALDRLRIGLELFQSHFMSASLGFAPVAGQRLLIDAESSRFKLHIAAEALCTRSELPLPQHELFSRLAHVMETVFGFDLRRDYAAKVS